MNDDDEIDISSNSVSAIEQNTEQPDSVSSIEILSSDSNDDGNGSEESDEVEKSYQAFRRLMEMKEELSKECDAAKERYIKQQMAWMMSRYTKDDCEQVISDVLEEYTYRFKRRGKTTFTDKWKGCFHFKFGDLVVDKEHNPGIVLHETIFFVKVWYFMADDEDGEDDGYILVKLKNKFDSELKCIMSCFVGPSFNYF